MLRKSPYARYEYEWNNHKDKKNHNEDTGCKVVINPALSFTEADMQAICTAGRKLIDSVRSDGRDGARRLYAFILFLRYTGLPISDAVGCSVDRPQDGKL